MSDGYNPRNEVDCCIELVDSGGRVSYLAYWEDVPLKECRTLDQARKEVCRAYTTKNGITPC